MATDTTSSTKSDERRGAAIIADGPARARPGDDDGAVRIKLAEQHESIDDHAMGQLFVRGTAVGIPVTWAISTLMLLQLPIERPVAALAAIFVAIASGPFFGSTAFLMAKIVQLDRHA